MPPTLSTSRSLPPSRQAPRKTPGPPWPTTWKPWASPWTPSSITNNDPTDPSKDSMPSPVSSAAHTAAPAQLALPQHTPLVAAIRDGLVESVHYGSAVALAADGSVAASAGTPLAPFYPRS